MMGYSKLSVDEILVKFKGKPFDIAVTKVYGPTKDADCNEMDNFFENVEAAMSQCKSQDIIIVIFIIGDINVKVGECKEVDVVGPLFM